MTPAQEGAASGRSTEGLAARVLVGRARELERLGAALAEARGGRGSLVLLAGEPGIGKTRLADELAARAQAAGTLVLWGRGWEAGGAPAYWPWLEALAALARGLEVPALEETLGDGLPLVTELVPELAARLPPRPASAPPPPDVARFRLWRAVAGLMRRGAAPAGLLLVLDDLHAADRASLLLLHFLSRELRSSRALVLGTLRDVEARLDPETGELLARIGREGETLSLGRLDREESARLLRERAGVLAPGVAARLLERTQGNPLFLEELARLLGQEGGGLDVVLAGGVPPGVRDIIRQRLARVPDEARPLLELAAVAGDELDERLLAAVTGRATAALTVTLDEAARAGVLGRRGERRRFSHALVREVLYRDLAEAERRALHGRIAAALEGTTTASEPAPVDEIAHHLLNGPTEGIGKAVEFAERAADRALECLAYEEAAASLERALAVVGASGGPAALRAPLMLALARARIRGGNANTARTLCRDVAAVARAAKDAELLARAALTYGLVFSFGVVDPVLVGMLEEALEALPPGDNPVRVRLLARLGSALQPARSSDEPVRVARSAIEMARRLGDPRTLLETLHAAIAAMMDVVDPRERAALNLETEALALAHGDRERLLRTQARLVLDYTELGELAQADTRIVAFEAQAAELRAPWHAWRGPLFRAMRASMHGRFDEAERLFAETARAGAEAGDPEFERWKTIYREGLLRTAERHEDMLAHDVIVRRARAGFLPLAWHAMASALVCARLEDAAGARLHIDLMPSDYWPPVDNPYALFFIAEPVAYVRDEAKAARLVTLLEPARDRNVMLGMTAMSWEGPVSRLLALLYASLVRWPEAEAAFEHAIARARALDAGPILARTRYELGRALLQRGGTGDGARAAGLFEEARAGATALGMTGLVRLIDARRPAVPAAVAKPAVPATTDASPLVKLALEGEYWTLAHAGGTLRLKDSLGLHYLARLLAEPDRELHVLDLVGRGEGGAAEPVDAGDAGELLDDTARESYRRRVEDLRDVVEEAERFGDAVRATRAREELGALAAELGRAVGLGGRVRRAGGAAERARSAVQRRIKNAIDRIGEQAPELAVYLGRTIKTGNYCVFRPQAAART